jgi:hypothetical protein
MQTGLSASGCLLRFIIVALLRGLHPHTYPAQPLPRELHGRVTQKGPRDWMTTMTLPQKHRSLVFLCACTTTFVLPPTLAALKKKMPFHSDMFGVSRGGPPGSGESSATKKKPIYLHVCVVCVHGVRV